MRLRLIALSLIASLFCLSAIPVSAEDLSVGDPGKSWTPPDDADRGLHVQWFQDSWQGDAFSVLMDNALRSNPKVDPTCRSIDDPRCKSENLMFAALLPYCVSSSDVYCIEEFGVVSASGEKTKATFNRSYPTKAQNAFDGSPALHIPPGRTGSLFNLPSAAHPGGDLYYVSVLTGGTALKNSLARLQAVTIKIFPVALQDEPRIGNLAGGTEAGWSPCPEDCAGQELGVWRNAGTCLSSKGFCVANSGVESNFAQRYSFPAGKKYYVKVRTQDLPGGWMHGRFSEPDISISGKSGNYSIEVAANPIAVPVVHKTYKYPEMPQALKDQYDVLTGVFKPEVATWTQERIRNHLAGGCGRSACTPDPLTRNMMTQPSPYDPYGMDQLKLWLPFVEDKATALFGTWSIRTLEAGEVEGALPCFVDSSKGVTGVVTTNATQYFAGPPKFNTSDQSLEYKVAAPHLTPQGKVFYGTYDLLMRSDVARCVYNFSNAPIRGTISVISAEGEQKVATESVKEANGWVSLSAQGFTYSQPVIKVKLSQDKVAASPVVAQKKKSITCVKGKTVKKVAGVNPKCPTGFRKR